MSFYWLFVWCVSRITQIQLCKLSVLRIDPINFWDGTRNVLTFFKKVPICKILIVSPGNQILSPWPGQPPTQSLSALLQCGPLTFSGYNAWIMM